MCQRFVRIIYLRQIHQLIQLFYAYQPNSMLFSLMEGNVLCTQHRLSVFPQRFRFRIDSFDRDRPPLDLILIFREFVTTKSRASGHTTILWHCLLPLLSLLIPATTRAPSSERKSRGGHSLGKPRPILTSHRLKICLFIA